MPVYGYVLRTVDSEAEARESWVPFVIAALVALGHNVVSWLPVISTDMGNFVEPRGVVDVACDVNLLSSSEGDVREHCQQQLGINEGHFVH